MNYSDIFDLRGQMYHQAMTQFTNARDKEFQLPLSLCQIKPGDTVVDIPSGGGYLQSYFQLAVNYLCLEPSAQFAEFCRLQNLNVHQYTGNHLPLPAGYADLVISIAGMHHIADKHEIFSDMRRILKPNGQFCIADVQHGSNVALFLDDIVDRYTETGHAGNYFSVDTLCELQDAGFDNIKITPLNYEWQFDNEHNMVEFCRLLFGMEKASAQNVLDGIKKYLRVRSDDNRVYMEWSLLAFSSRV